MIFDVLTVTSLFISGGMSTYIYRPERLPPAMYWFKRPYTMTVESGTSNSTSTTHQLCYFQQITYILDFKDLTSGSVEQDRGDHHQIQLLLGVKEKGERKVDCNCRILGNTL